MSETARHTYTQSHAISGEVLLLDVDAEAAAVLEAARAAGAGHAARTLVKEGPLRMVLLGMKQGSRLRDHRVDGPVSVHVLAGEVAISSRGRTAEVRGGNALVLDADVEHSLDAKADSTVLLTIARPASGAA